ncbi:hypothetical protein ACEPAG_7341 [Sanghuangporus baumii]
MSSSLVQGRGGSSGSAPPPTPQEITRKLSVHNKPAKVQPVHGLSPPALSGTESDSDTFFSSEHSPLATSPPAGGSHPQPIVNPHGHGQNHSHSMSLGLSTSVSSKPLSSIAERRSGSGDEESDDNEEVDEDWTQDHNATEAARSRKQDGDTVIKTGYLYKKGERRKTWKKRWFVLRPAQLAFYKNSAEYQLLRLVDLVDVHSCSSIELKRHPNSLALVSPNRTYYLQANSEQEMQDWVQRVNEARESLLGTSTQNSATVASIPIPAAASGSRDPNIASQSPGAISGRGAPTPSPPSARSIGFAGPVTSDSESDDQVQGDVSKSYGTGTSPSKPQAGSTANKDTSKIILSGYLMKSRSKRKGWRKRYFVLTSDTLFYSASHMDTKRPRSIELAQVIDALEYDLSNDKNYTGGSNAISTPAIRESEDSHGHEADPANAAFTGTQYAFKIVTKKRPLLLCAPSEAEEIKWLSAVRALIARRSNPLGSTGNAQQNATTISGVADGSSSAARVKASSSMAVRKRSASGASGLPLARDDNTHY